MGKLRIVQFSGDLYGVEGFNFELPTNKKYYAFLPESIEYPEVTVNYESHNFFYSVGEFLIYTHTLLGSGSITFTMFARDRDAGLEMMKDIEVIRRLALPLKLEGDIVYPPPRLWLIFNSDAGDVYTLSTMRAMLVRLEGVGVRVLNMFEDMTPRVVEVTLNFREVVHPYTTYTQVRERR